MVFKTSIRKNVRIKSYPIVIEDDLGSGSWINNFIWLFYIAVIGIALIVVIIAGGVTAVQRIIESSQQREEIWAKKRNYSLN